MVSKKLRAGALLLSLLVATLIAVMTTALLLLLQYQRQHASRNSRFDLLERNLTSATALLLAQTGTISASGDTTLMDLFGDGTDSVKLIRRPWGVFEIGIASAYAFRDSASRPFLMGKVLPDTALYALYLADEHRPLSISGKTRIQGDAYLPEAGIRKSYIENEAYAYEEEIHGGTMLTSNPTLPPLDEVMLERLSAYLKPTDTAAWKAEATDWFTGIGVSDTLAHSFFDTPMLLHSPAPLRMAGISLRGGVIVVADSSITVAADAQLDNVLLFAPSIRFESGFCGRLQAFARDSIMVNAGCRLAYPSALGLVHIPRDTLLTEFQPFIRIDSASTVDGLVFSHFPGSEELMAVVRLGRDATVHGQVYADGLLELRGVVKGATLCRRFTLQTPSSLYENFVLGGIMDITGLSPYYYGSPLLNTGRLSRVANWLDDE